MLKNLTFFTFFTAIILSLYLISFSSGCESDPVTSSASFSGDVGPIFAANCSFPGCHNSVDRQSGLDMSNWEALMLRGSAFGAEVIPYNSKWSHLMQHINRVDTNISPFAEPLMPKVLPPYTNGQPLTRSLVEQVAAWIDRGAKNELGQVAFENITRKALITNQASDYVAVVNLDNNHLVRLVKVGETPAGVLASPHIVMADNRGTYFYVSLITEGYLEKYNALTYEKVGRIQMGVSPAHIIISDDGLTAYVTDFIPLGSVKVVNTQTMTIVNSISDSRMKSPHGLRLSHSGSLLFAATQISEFLYVIRTSDNTIEDIIPVDPSVPPNGNGTQNFYPYQVAVTPDDKYAFVTCRKSNDVRVFDIQTRTFIHNIPVGANPLSIEISPDGRWCYVPNQGSNSVSIIDVNSRSVIKIVYNAGIQPHQVDFTEDGHYAYVTCESRTGTFVHHPPVSSQQPGTTCVIDVWSGHEKVKDIEMASFPAGISITPGKGN